MWNVIADAGMATMTVNFSNDASWIGLGLGSVVFLAAVAIACTALWGARPSSTVKGSTPMSISYREAA